MLPCYFVLWTVFSWKVLYRWCLWLSLLLLIVVVLELQIYCPYLFLNQIFGQIVIFCTYYHRENAFGLLDFYINLTLHYGFFLFETPRAKFTYSIILFNKTAVCVRMSVNDPN